MAETGYQTLSIGISLRSALGSEILGDTLFGQLCWSLRNRFGDEHLGQLLQGYSQGNPFAVLSDALPLGYLPLPQLPLDRYQAVDAEELKTVKKRQWISTEHIHNPLSQWLSHAIVDPAESNTGRKSRVEPQPHNSISRSTGTTGKGAFAPYTQPVLWCDPEQKLRIYLLYDPQRVDEKTMVEALRSVGLTGYGRDSSIGLGKFDIESVTAVELHQSSNSNASLALAPCAPQGLGFDTENSFYTPFTRFGRHGGSAVHQGHPFKTPMMLTRRGALFADGIQSNQEHSRFVGQGIGGAGQLSRVVPETVHQGYAPVIRVRLEREEG